MELRLRSLVLALLLAPAGLLLLSPAAKGSTEDNCSLCHSSSRHLRSLLPRAFLNVEELRLRIRSVVAPEADANPSVPSITCSLSSPKADAGQANPDPTGDSRQVLTHATVQPYLAQPQGRFNRWMESGLTQVVQLPAAGPRTRYKKWSFVVAPYGWLAGTGGTITVDGEENDFDLSFEDLFDLTTGGFQLFAEARYKRFFLSFDGTWATLANEEDLLGGRADFTVEQTILELHAGYRLIGREFGASRPCACPSRPGAIALDAYVGARYWRTDISLNINLPGRPPIIPPKTFSGVGTDDWVEPLIGARFGLGIAPKFGVAINGNIGGFGIGDAADFTWTLTMIFNWQFARHWSAAFGWRTQSVVEMSGSGADRNGSEIVTTGPLVGIVFSF